MSAKDDSSEQGPVAGLGFCRLDYEDGQVAVHATVPSGIPVLGPMAIGAVRLDVDGTILNLEVDDDYRRRGVATALIRYLETEGIAYHHDAFLSADGQAFVASLTPAS